MLAEGAGGIRGAAGQVVREPHLGAERGAGADAVGLPAFGVPDRLGECDDLRGARGRDEQHAVVVGEHQVVAGHRPLPDGRGGQRRRMAGGQAQRPGRYRARAEHRQADRRDVGRVAMQTPDHDAAQARVLGLQRDQVADARLVTAAAVVHDQHVAGGRDGFQRFQEDVHAARVPRGHDPPGTARAGNDRLNFRRGTADRDAGPDAGVGNVCRCQGPGERNHCRYAQSIFRLLKWRSRERIHAWSD